MGAGARWRTVRALVYVDAEVPAGTVGEEVAPEALETKGDRMAWEARRRSKIGVSRLRCVSLEGRVRFVEVETDVQLALPPATPQQGSPRRRRGGSS